MPIIFSLASKPLLIVLLICLFVTDFLDGKLARLWDVSTVGGATLDPLGDKILAISCILALVGTNKNMFALLIFELLISIINIIKIIYGKSTRSILIGKIKTWFLSINLILGTLEVFLPNVIDKININILNISFYTALFFESLTFITYLLDTLRMKGQKHLKLKDIKLRTTLRRMFDEKRYKEDKDKSIVEIIESGC